MIKNTICDSFDITILNDTYEGILWLKLVHKLETFTLMRASVTCRLKISSRYFDVNIFYDCLLTDIYTFQNDGMIYVCGDFNSRCGDQNDFIAGVDDIQPRNVIYFTDNLYGDLFVDFLINTNLCMLNGRSGSVDNFTSVSVKGSSVVDYCITTHDNMCNRTDFSVTLTSQLVNTSGDLRSLTPTSMPDHTMLSWNIVSNTFSEENDVVHDHTSFDKFDLANVTNSFMTSFKILVQVNMLIDTLEQGFRTENDIDLVYSDWCSILKQNMYTDISYKTIVSSSTNKRHRPGKLWWSGNLTNVWSKLRIVERKWLNCCNRNDKVTFKAEYVQARKLFDREVQKAKICYWFTMQNELLTDCNVDQSKCWQSIGKIGVGV